jgi:hypothetical protein
MTARNFWKDIDLTLDRIESEKPQTFDALKMILDDFATFQPAYFSHSSGENISFFAGSGGDKTLADSLIGAGWKYSYAKADYDYALRNAENTEFLRYLEGDVIRTHNPKL